MRPVLAPTSAAAGASAVQSTSFGPVSGCTARHTLLPSGDESRKRSAIAVISCKWCTAIVRENSRVLSWCCCQYCGRSIVGGPSPERLPARRPLLAPTIVVVVMAAAGEAAGQAKQATAVFRIRKAPSWNWLHFRG